MELGHQKARTRHRLLTLLHFSCYVHEVERRQRAAKRLLSAAELKALLGAD
jgi:hypothetical protein